MSAFSSILVKANTWELSLGGSYERLRCYLVHGVEARHSKQPGAHFPTYTLRKDARSSQSVQMDAIVYKAVTIKRQAGSISIPKLL